jgi:O-antigen ligase
MLPGSIASRLRPHEQRLRTAATVGLFAVALGLAVAGGQGPAGLVLVVAAAVAYRRLGFAGVVAVAFVALALASSSIVRVKDAGLVIRWPALVLVAGLPVLHARLALRTRTVQLAAALLAWCLLTAVWSYARLTTVEHWAAFALALFAGLVAGPAALAAPGQTRRLIRCLVAIGAAGALVALAVGAAAPATGRPLGPLRGWLENSNTIGLWCAFLLPTVFVLERRRWRAAAAAPMLAAIVWSQSRSALLSLTILALIVLAPGARRVALRAVAALVLVSAVLLAAAPNVAHHTVLRKFQNPGGAVVSVTGGRSEAWGLALRITRTAPLEGVGFGTSEAIYDAPAIQGTFTYFVGDNPNNAYLQALMETGVVGLLALLALIAWLALQAWSRPLDRDRRLLAACGTVLVLGAVVESILVAAGNPFALPVWLALGVAAHGRTAPLPSPARALARVRRSAPRLAPVAVALVVAAIVGAVGVRGYRTSRAGATPPTERAQLQQAARLLPPGAPYLLQVPPEMEARARAAAALYFPRAVPVSDPARARWILAYLRPDAGAGFPVERRWSFGSIVVIKLRRADAP